MENKLTLRYFNLERCGYWTMSKQQPNRYENLAATLAHLQSYVVDKTIEETGIRQGLKNPQTFLLDIQQSHDFWVLALWNLAAEGSADEIVSLNMSSKFGNVSSEPVTASKGSTFGFVSYFLICPNLRFYATLMPSNATLAGRDAFETYMKNFLWIDPNFIEHTAELQTNDDGSEAIMDRVNFHFNPALQGMPTPYFSGRLVKTPSEKEYIIKNFNKIKQMHNRFTLRVTPQQSSKKLLKKFIPSMYGNTNLFAPLETIRVNHSVSAAFSKEKDIRTWIDEWEIHSADIDNDDCGFKLEKDDKIYWLRGNTITTSLNASRLHKTNGIYPVQEILNLINLARDQILADFNLAQLNNAI